MMTLALVALVLAQATPAADRRMDLATIVLVADQSIPEVDAVVDEAATTMFRAGPIEPGWPDIGVDIAKSLGGRPGGIDRTILHGDAETPTIRYFGRAEVPLPAQLTETTVYSDGPASAGTVPDVTVVHIAGNLWMKTRAAVRVKGNLRCTEGTPHFGLLTDPAKPLGERDVAAGVAIVKAARKFRAVEVCSAFMAVGDGFVERVFLPDGRSLPAMDDEMTPLKPAPLAGSAAILAQPARLLEDAAAD